METLSSLQQTSLEGLLADLARCLGVDGLALDRERSCALRFEPGRRITLQQSWSDPQELWLHCDLGTVPDDVQVYQVMLRGNLLWQATAGATLSLTDEDTPRVILARALRWREVDGEHLLGRIHHLLDAAEDWRALLDETADPAWGRPEDETPPGGLDLMHARGLQA